MGESPPRSSYPMTTQNRDPLRRGLSPEEAAPYYAPALGMVMESGSVAIPSQFHTSAIAIYSAPPDNIQPLALTSHL